MVVPFPYLNVATTVVYVVACSAKRVLPSKPSCPISLMMRRISPNTAILTRKWVFSAFAAPVTRSSRSLHHHGAVSPSPAKFWSPPSFPCLPSSRSPPWTARRTVASPRGTSTSRSGSSSAFRRPRCARCWPNPTRCVSACRPKRASPAYTSASGRAPRGSLLRSLLRRVASGRRAAPAPAAERAAAGGDRAGGEATRGDGESDPLSAVRKRPAGAEPRDFPRDLGADADDGGVSAEYDAVVAGDLDDVPRERGHHDADLHPAERGRQCPVGSFFWRRGEDRRGR